MTRNLLECDKSFKDEAKLLDLMNHFIFSEFTRVFLFIYDYMAAQFCNF